MIDEFVFSRNHNQSGGCDYMLKWNSRIGSWRFWTGSYTQVNSKIAFGLAW